MNFKPVSEENYADYRHMFNEDYCNQTFVESAFKYKSFPLKVNNIDNPSAAFLDFKFAIIYVGEVASLTKEEVITILPEGKVIVGKQDLWKAKLLEFFEGKVIERRRTRLSHQNLSLEKLRSLKKPLPNGYVLERVDKETAEKLPEILQVHIPILYGSVDNFMKQSIGFCVKKGDEVVSMASSTVPYTDLLEMQVATVDSPEYRRKGFGTAVSVALIEYCLENGIVPVWEAANDRSVEMALKIGYTNPKDIYQYYWSNK